LVIQETNNGKKLLQPMLKATISSLSTAKGIFTKAVFKVITSNAVHVAD